MSRVWAAHLRWIGWGTRAVLRTYTLRRALQAAHSWVSFLLARKGWAFHPPRYPLFLGVEPTTACNLRCPHCISGLRAFSRPTGRLDPALLERLLAELHPYLWGVLFYFQGEPLLHPEIGRLIRLADQYRLLTSLSTNGHFLTEEKIYELLLAGLVHLRLSLDGMTPQTYSRYRQEGDLQTVLEGLKRLLRLRKALRSPFPLVEVQFIAFRHNVHEIPLFLRWAYQIGVERASVKKAQLLQPSAESYNEWIPPEASRYTVEPNGEVQLTGPLPQGCWRLWRAAEITWDGQVLPCCFDKNADHAFGKVQQGFFHEVWHSPAAHRFRKTVFRHRESIDICRNCSEGIKPWL